MKKLRFITTLLPIFYLWQTFSLCPFALKKISLQPTIHKTHTIIFIGSISIQIVVMIHGLIKSNNYIENQISDIMQFVYVYSMFEIRLIGIIILIESKVKQSTHMDLLMKIAEIDSILSEKLKINLKYTKQRRSSLIRSIIAAFLYFTLEVTSFIISYIEEEGFFTIFLILHMIPLFICSLRYTQVISYLYLVRHRCRTKSYKILQMCVVHTVYCSKPAK